MASRNKHAVRLFSVATSKVTRARLRQHPVVAGPRGLITIIMCVQSGYTQHCLVLYTLCVYKMVILKTVCVYYYVVIPDTLWLQCGYSLHCVYMYISHICVYLHTYWQDSTALNCPRLFS